MAPRTRSSRTSTTDAKSARAAPAAPAEVFSDCEVAFCSGLGIMLLVALIMFLVYSCYTPDMVAVKDRLSDVCADVEMALRNTRSEHVKYTCRRDGDTDWWRDRLYVELPWRTSADGVVAALRERVDEINRGQRAEQDARQWRDAIGGPYCGSVEEAVLCGWESPTHSCDYTTPHHNPDDRVTVWCRTNIGRYDTGDDEWGIDWRILQVTMMESAAGPPSVDEGASFIRRCHEEYFQNVGESRWCSEIVRRNATTDDALVSYDCVCSNANLYIKAATGAVVATVAVTESASKRMIRDAIDRQFESLYVPPRDLWHCSAEDYLQSGDCVCNCGAAVHPACRSLAAPLRGCYETPCVDDACVECHPTMTQCVDGQCYTMYMDAAATAPLDERGVVLTGAQMRRCGNTFA